MQSESRRIQNLFKHLRWSVFAKTVSELKSLPVHGKLMFMLQLKSKAGVRRPKRSLDDVK